ncbi:MAG: NUDIX hydrolase [Flavihumibacter sp.]
MYIKIYFGDKPLFLCDSVSRDIAPFLHHDDAVYVDEFSPHAIHAMLHEMEKPAVHAGILQHTDLEALQKAVWKKFTLLQAGGGAVWKNDRLLFIHRRGKWDLPKGKLDPGETIEECAVREVAEETGVTAAVRRPLLPTYHTYHEAGKHILKESVWFEMKADGGDAEKPQAEEEITELKWLPREEWPAVLNNTFPSIKDVLAAL